MPVFGVAGEGCASRFPAGIALALTNSCFCSVRHLEEEQVGEQFDVVAVRHAVIAQDVAHWTMLAG